MLSLIDSWDKAVVVWVQEHAHFPLLTSVMQALSSREFWFIPVVLIWLYLFIKGGRCRVAALLILPMMLLSDYCTAKVLKPLFGRPRPLGHGGFAFPSVHATNAFATAALLSYFVRNLPFRIIAICAATLVALSRVYLGVHYPTDIAAGALLGVLDAAIIIFIYYLFRSFLETRAPLLFQPASDLETSSADEAGTSEESGSNIKN